MLPRPTVPISAENSVWPDIQSELILPPGMTTAEAWAKHTMRDLLLDFDAKTSPVQLVPHRGLPNYANAIPDGSMEALRRATVGRKTLVEVPWSLWTPPPGARMLKYIVRDVESPEFTEKYVPTNLSITALLHGLWELLSYNSAVTFFLNGRYEDGAKLAALLSNNPAYLNNALVQIYPYVFRNGSEFADMVNKFDPAPSWRRMVSIVPVLNPDTLPTLARVGRQSLEYSALYKAGKDWISSMIDTDMKIFGLGFPLSGIGLGVDLSSGETHDLNGGLVTEPKIKAMFLWDRVLLDLVAWAKETHPILAIIMPSITYSYSYDGKRYTNTFHTGHPGAWPEGAESHGRELMAVPGNALRHGANIVICDRVNDNLNAALRTKTYAWPADVDYPTHNIKISEEGHGTTVLAVTYIQHKDPDEASFLIYMNPRQLLQPEIKCSVTFEDAGVTQTYLIEEFIDEATQGKFTKYIFNDSPSLLPHLNAESNAIAQYLSFAQHIKYIKTKELAYAADPQDLFSFRTSSNYDFTGTSEEVADSRRASDGESDDFGEKNMVLGIRDDVLKDQ
ncbi:hypothetical protein K503DRAFT_860564 [Rhizopogon vinicolor AM-OR11-026]|uniref:Uncharacterized protein n=1 Tax=Rhizopogon vinicolor AM-OR11-026 TaxID=1314800 RepID=A0A1B7MH27_9AGAM|nr:hypothetical protein K503DRAFT_860564 [Rhizopogon vinicolor AM-OR11-026]